MVLPLSTFNLHKLLKNCITHLSPIINNRLYIVLFSFGITVIHELSKAYAIQSIGNKS